MHVKWVNMLSCFFLYMSQFTQFPFEHVHYDVWTSLIMSITDIKYCIIFLNDFPYFLSVYPLRAKFGLFSKFLHFQSYVHLISL